VDIDFWLEQVFPIRSADAFASLNFFPNGVELGHVSLFPKQGATGSASALCYL
jgi:hypothetical protein